ncbi:MAG: hypothetical protein E3J66_00010 [Dehalococcoidia bacterium]|nr:MAG: hypothetical protein E3J66_00010 [Dehalococcoidia bacterium]
MAHIQDIHRFPARFTPAKFGELFWHDTQSGLFQAEETPVGTSGNAICATTLSRHSTRYRCTVPVRTLLRHLL